MSLKIWILKLILGLMTACPTAFGKRISQIKCQEYIDGTTVSVSVISLIINPSPTVFQSFDCSKTVQLIIGGIEARKGEFPHQALLGWEAEQPGQYTFDCGGTLISERYVLTAAHCASKLFATNPEPSVVRFAEMDLTQDGDEFDIAIDRITRHPRHRFGRIYHDIALVRLKENAPFSKLVRPACLWDDEDTNFSTVIATGFGRFDPNSDKGSDVLRQVQLDALDPSVCNNQFAQTRNFPRGMTGQQLCIGSKRAGRDTCQGDSGGPVQMLVNPKGCIYHVLGVTSAGSACGVGTTPALYTKVASYIDWIEEVVWGH